MASFTSMLTPSFSLVGVASSAVVGIWGALFLRGGMLRNMGEVKGEEENESSLFYNQILYY